MIRIVLSLSLNNRASEAMVVLRENFSLGRLYNFLTSSFSCSVNFIGVFFYKYTSEIKAKGNKPVEIYTPFN